MKVSYHRCDFCGGKVASGTPMAKLTVPLSSEEVALRKRTQASREEHPMNAIDAMYREMLGIRRDTSTEAQTTYDMCTECARGILMSRFRELRRKLAMEE